MWFDIEKLSAIPIFLACSRIAYLVTVYHHVTLSHIFTDFEMWQFHFACTVHPMHLPLRAASSTLYNESNFWWTCMIFIFLKIIKKSAEMALPATSIERVIRFPTNMDVGVALHQLVGITIFLKRSNGGADKRTSVCNRHRSMFLFHRKSLCAPSICRSHKLRVFNIGILRFFEPESLRLKINN